MFSVPDSGNVQTLKKEEVFLYEIGGNIGKDGFWTTSLAIIRLLGALSVHFTEWLHLFTSLILPDTETES